MGRRCGVTALEKAAIGGCVATASGPTQLREKTSNTVFFCGDTEAECGHALKQRVECGCGASGGTDAHVVSLPQKILRYFIVTA